MGEHGMSLEGHKHREILDALIRTKGLRAGEYAPFFVTWEGGDPAEASGFVIDRRAEVRSFWLAWDKQRCPYLSEWEQVEPDASWSSSGEYVEARRRVGLEAA